MTGETISGQAYIYGAALDSYVTRSRDLVLLQNGEVDIADFTNGDPIIDFLAAQLRRASAAAPPTPPSRRRSSRSRPRTWTSKAAKGCYI